MVQGQESRVLRCLPTNRAFRLWRLPTLRRWWCPRELSCSFHVRTLSSSDGPEVRRRYPGSKIPLLRARQPRARPLRCSRIFHILLYSFQPFTTPLVQQLVAATVSTRTRGNSFLYRSLSMCRRRNVSA